MMPKNASPFAMLAMAIAFMVALAIQPAAAQTPPMVPANVIPGNVVATGDAAAPAVSLVDGYILGPGDVIEIAVIGRSDFQGRVQVQTDGTIQLPYIGTLTAAEKTVLQLRDEIRSALMAGGFFADPAVQIGVATYASRYVTVLGEVGTPGLLPVDRAYRLSEIIARVGGTRPTSADDVILTRASGEELTLSIRAAATGGGASDPIVNPGDKLFVAVAEQFYIYGQVNSPGTYRVDRNMSLRMALARGGGLTALGSERRVRVIRDGVEIRNFNPNDPIRGGDVVVVGERFF